MLGNIDTRKVCTGVYCCSDNTGKAEKKVKVFIPKESRNDTERFVSVNGERILIQTGKTVEVPENGPKYLALSESLERV